jgi:hypothetical protein
MQRKLCYLCHRCVSSYHSNLRAEHTCKNIISLSRNTRKYRRHHVTRITQPTRVSTYTARSASRIKGKGALVSKGTYLSVKRDLMEDNDDANVTGAGKA